MLVSRISLPVSGALIALLAALCGCYSSPSTPQNTVAPLDLGPFEALAEARSTEVLTLYPTRMEMDEGVTEESETFHGYRILGRASIGPATSRKLLSEVARSVASSDGKVAACFNPRHGIRCEMADGPVDIVICFECFQLHVYPTGAERDSHLLGKKGVAEVDRIFEAQGLEIHRGF